VDFVPQKAFKSYRARDRKLKKLGFPSYAEYLASDLWKSIRARVFKRDGHKCRACGKPAANAHHYTYSRPGLAGLKIGTIWSLCRSCHKFIEFNQDGTKAHPREVKRRLKLLCHLNGVPLSYPKPEAGPLLQRKCNSCEREKKPMSLADRILKLPPGKMPRATGYRKKPPQKVRKAQKQAKRRLEQDPEYTSHRWSQNSRLWFGKYQNVPIKEIPQNYLTGLIDDITPGEDWRKDALRLFLQRYTAGSWEIGLQPLLADTSQ